MSARRSHPFSPSASDAYVGADHVKLPTLALPHRALTSVDTKPIASNFPNKHSQRICFPRVFVGNKVQLLQLLKGLIVKLHFRSNDLEGMLWKQRTADRLRQALGRVQGLVAHVRVRLDDINGPAAGVDKRCSVEILVRGSSTVAISATSRSWQDSVEEVASRIRQRVVLQLHRATVAKYRSMALVPVRATAGSPVAVAKSPRRLRFD